MTRAELMQRMTSREFVEWQLYHALEPFGAQRDATHAAIVASTIANFSGFAKRAMQVSDFMPQYDQVSEAELSETERQELQRRREQDLYQSLHALAQKR